LGREGASNASQVVLVEQVRTTVLAKSKNENLIADREGKRGCPTEVEIPRVERTPILRGKIVLVAGPVQIGSKAEHGFTIAPVGGTKRVACRDKEGLTNSADSSRCPDAAASRACGPAEHLSRFLQGHPDNPAVVIATIPEVAAKWQIERAVDYGQGTTLVLVARIEGLRCSA
jgi:hypothetical protein